MTRPVFIAKTALLCSRGESPSAVAGALWNGECNAGQRKIGERAFPYFGLPLNEADWMLRAEQAIRQVGIQLSQLVPETPLFIASSSFQLDAARSLIGAGPIDDAIVLGVELANNSTLAGFAAMELLSHTAGRPFDARRDGLVLGEAVAAVYLSAKPSTWRIAGLRTGLDGYSTTGPNPDGSRIASVAVDCLKEANLPAADIELIKLQAAGSPGTDLAEANALRSVFGQRMPPLISLKPALGHTLGASGMAELAALLACLDADKIPATAGFSKVDPEIALFPMVDRSTAHIEHALLNLIGFGGGLACLIVERQR